MDDPARITEVTAKPHTPSVNPVRMVVFVVLSAAFIIWLALGQIEARVWVAGRLTLLDRHISSMWRYLGNNLPDVPASSFIAMLFWLSISFVVVGTIAGLWLFLCTPDDQPHDETWESIHAAHLHHDSH